MEIDIKPHDKGFQTRSRIRILKNQGDIKNSSCPRNATIRIIAMNCVQEQLNINRITSNELFSNNWRQGEKFRSRYRPEKFYDAKTSDRGAVKPTTSRMQFRYNVLSATGAIYMHRSQLSF